MGLACLYKADQSLYKKKPSPFQAIGRFDRILKTACMILTYSTHISVLLLFAIFAILTFTFLPLWFCCMPQKVIQDSFSFIFLSP